MMDAFISQFHFLRPLWFLAFIPLLLLSALIIKHRLFSRRWQSIIAPELLPHLLVGKQAAPSPLAAVIFFVTGSLIIISLAGPVWEKRPQPVFKEKSALVIALDLSRSMDANDIKPSRLNRARYKIADILNRRTEGQTALIAYAADAFIVTPLTDDTLTINSLLSSLTTDLMPAQGTRTDKAIEKAASLLKNAAIKQGDILLVTDSIESAANDKFKQIAKQHRISILAIATTEGAPIPMPNGGFVKDNRGAIVLPKLNITNLNKFSQLGHGRLSIISSNDDDIINITSLLSVNRFQAKADKETRLTDSLTTDSWYEQGPWLLLLIIPFVAFSFRRGLIFIIPLIFLIQHPQTAEANNGSGLWDKLWNNSNQRAMKIYKQKPATAAELFNDKQWKAAALYKSEQYQKSIDTLKKFHTADAHYNKGNAYAKLGQTEQAIKEYSMALKLDPEHKDARYNKKLLEEKKSRDKQKDSKQSKNGKSSEQDDKKQSAKENNKANNDKADNNTDSGVSNNDSKNKKPTDTTTANKKPDQSENNGLKSPQQEANKNRSDKPKSGKLSHKDAQSKQATEQWLRRIPDDPGGLLRNKFLYQYKRQQHTNEDNAW